MAVAKAITRNGSAFENLGEKNALSCPDVLTRRLRNVRSSDGVEKNRSVLFKGKRKNFKTLVRYFSSSGIYDFFSP